MFRFLVFADADVDADADEDDEFFDPSDFDDEDAARSERTEARSLLFSAVRLDAAAATSILSRPIPPFALFVALHNHDAIYLLEGDNVGRGEYPPSCQQCGP